MRMIILQRSHSAPVCRPPSMCKSRICRLHRVKFLFLAITFLLTPCVSRGYVVEIDITAVALIYNEHGEFRVLLKFEAPDIPDSFRVDFASIIIPKCQDTPEVSVEAYGLSRPWDASTVGWSYPWDGDGGDFSAVCLSKWAIHPGVGARGHFIDVTEYVRSIVRQGGNYGLILTPAKGSDTGFSPDAARVFSDLESVKLRVLYKGKE